MYIQVLLLSWCVCFVLGTGRNSPNTRPPIYEPIASGLLDELPPIYEPEVQEPVDTAGRPVSTSSSSSSRSIEDDSSIRTSTARINRPIDPRTPSRQSSRVSVSTERNNRGWIQVAKDIVFLRDSNIGIDEFGSQGDRPICILTAENDLKALQALIILGAKIEVTCRSGNTPLDIAVINSNVACVDLYLQRLPLLSETKNKAFYLAIRNGNRDMAIRFQRRGVDVNYEGDSGTAMIMSATLGNLEMVTYLVSIGADVNLKERISRRNALQIILASPSIATNIKTITEAMLNNGLNINDIDSQRNTALMIAVSKSRFEIIELLLENNAEINLRNIQGQTALTLATDERIRQLISSKQKKQKKWF